MLRSFPYASQQFRGKTAGNMVIHQGLISVIYIYPWWIGEWPAYTPIMAFIFTLWKSLCYVMDLKLIDFINVSYMLYRSILFQMLPAFSKWIVKWKEDRKAKDSWFWWQMQAGRAIWGWGEDAKIFDHILWIYWVPSWKYENMPGKSRGILREKLSHIYSYKPTCC